MTDLAERYGFEAFEDPKEDVTRGRGDAVTVLDRAGFVDQFGDVGQGDRTVQRAGTRRQRDLPEVGIADHRDRQRLDYSPAHLPLLGALHDERFGQVTGADDDARRLVEAGVRLAGEDPPSSSSSGCRARCESPDRRG